MRSENSLDLSPILFTPPTTEGSLFRWCKPGVSPQRVDEKEVLTVLRTKLKFYRIKYGTTFLCKHLQRRSCSSIRLYLIVHVGAERKLLTENLVKK